jgi:hypothetical protein
MRYLGPTSVRMMSICGMLNEWKRSRYGMAVFLWTHSVAGSILVFPGRGPGRPSLLWFVQGTVGMVE